MRGMAPPSALPRELPTVSQNSIFYPVLVQVLLTLAVLMMMGPARSRSMRENRQHIDDKDVRLGQNVWTEQAIKVSNNFKNQFELPVLFYAACAFALLLRQVDGVMIALAWVFVVTRIAHTVVHVGPNIVAWRAAAYLIGAVAVLAMWLVLGWRVWAGA